MDLDLCDKVLNALVVRNCDYVINFIAEKCMLKGKVLLHLSTCCE